MPSVGYARLYSPSCNLLIARSTGSGEKKSTEGADPVPWMKKMSAEQIRPLERVGSARVQRQGLHPETCR
ncbi:hypothetical protein AV530_004676 [Patagioenas fasciata monilis]|uniref:Uncharacterized protein n=1 Tax=Patagioenas fasciata monilis TaxID=372326 RepID=A0A1V4KHY8_PATFA|nr:hypothetical protein AV530_004676 [Patagioenas fasciata monilis]